MVWVLLVFIALMVLINGGVLWFCLRKTKEEPNLDMVVGTLAEYTDPSLGPLAELKGQIEKLESKTVDSVKKIAQSLELLPGRTLNTIQGSANTTTGKLGELIKFIELQRAYDRIFPVGDIVDFIGVRFPTATDKGAIDFIDVKTGDKAVLNSDQKKLRDMINNSKETITFKLVKVDIT